MSLEPNRNLIVTVAKPIDRSEEQATVKSTFLIMTFACAIISIVPPVRIVGSLLGRGLALMSRTFDLGYESNKRTFTNWEKALEISKLGAIALGFIAVAVASPILIVASLAADAGMQAIELVKALYKGDKTKALMHLGLLAIDTLIITAIAAASWKLMIAAAAVSAAVLIILAAKLAYSAKNEREFVDSMCYLGLAALGITSAVQVAEITKQVPVKEHYTVTNTRNHCAKFHDTTGKTYYVPVGKSAQFFDRPGYYWNGGQFTSKSDYVEYGTVVLQRSLPVEDFANLAVGTHLINLDEPTKAPTNPLTERLLGDNT